MHVANFSYDWGRHRHRNSRPTRIRSIRRFLYTATAVVNGDGSSCTATAKRPSPRTIGNITQKFRISTRQTFVYAHGRRPARLTSIVALQRRDQHLHYDRGNHDSRGGHRPYLVQHGVTDQAGQTGLGLAMGLHGRYRNCRPNWHSDDDTYLSLRSSDVRR